MAIVNGYCTEDELIEWNRAKTPASSLIIQRAITACSRGIDRFTERTYFQTEESRAFDVHWVCDSTRGRHQVVALGPYNDLVEIDTVKTDDNLDGTFVTTWAAGDYQAFPLNPNAGPEPRPYDQIRSTGTRVFPERYAGRRAGLVQITGTWGWPQIPADINQACVMHAARIFNRKDSPQGVAGWGEFGVIRVGRTDPDVVAFLDPYQYYGGIGFA